MIVRHWGWPIKTRAGQRESGGREGPGRIINPVPLDAEGETRGAIRDGTAISVAFAPVNLAIRIRE